MSLSANTGLHVDENKEMNLGIFEEDRSQEVIYLFERVFSESEGKDEGLIIRNLVHDLISTTPDPDLFGYIASDREQIIGSIFFSRLTFENGPTSFILSPVAIDTNCQGKGVGQKLITFGIEQLRSRGIELVFTYGDPNFYSKVGFKQISEAHIESPFKLSQPEGWLAQSLISDTIGSISGTSCCVEALNNRDYW